jgi:uncharacterized membrane protein HdeD (DUF308 family)
MAEYSLGMGIEEVREHRGWFLAVGIALIVLGFIALSSSVTMTLVSVMFLGWLLIFSGIFQAIHGLARQGWSGFFINLLCGVLYTVTGFLMVSNPGIAAVTLTLMIAMLLIVAGAFRLLVAIFSEMPHRGWLVFDGIITLVLGVSIWRSWPLSGLWVIGLFIGIDLIFDGFGEVMLVLGTRT